MEHAGSLLQAARLVQSMELTDKNDFGDGCHMASIEPFFYDSAYSMDDCIVWMTILEWVESMGVANGHG